MNRYFSSFVITGIIYALIFGSLLYSFDDIKQISSQPKQNQDNVKFTIIAQTKEEKKIEKKPLEKPVEEKKTVKKEPVKKIEKIVKKEKPSPIKKKPVKKIVKKEPPKKPEKKTVKKEPIEKVVKKEAPKQVKTDKNIAKQQIKQQKTIAKNEQKLIDKDIIKAKQNAYFKMVKEAISKNKEYPKSALRRGIQGDVKVIFTISKYGELIKFDILEGKRIFKKSIKTAFDRTFPVKPPKDIFLSNTDLSITIAYRLN